MKLLGVSGGLSQSTNVVIEKALGFVSEYDSSITIEAVNAAEHDIQNCDGRDPSKYEGDTKLIIDKIKDADALIIGTPMYRGSYTGILKNVFDILPNDALMGKPVGLIATGGSPYHFLALEHELKPLLGFFQAMVIPGYVYVTREHFSHKDLVSEEIIEQLNELAKSIVNFARLLAGNTDTVIGPGGPRMYRRMY